jgi:branched-chain amino acid transport system substrate-binding protein
VAVVYQAGAYGEGLEAAFASSFAETGGTSQGFPFSNAGGRSDALAQIEYGGFDEVLFASSDATDVIAFVQGSVPLTGFDTLPIFLTDAARNADVLEALKGQEDRLAQVRGTVVTQPAGQVYGSFAASYAAEYGADDVSVYSYTAQSFDAAWLVIMGHAWALYQEGEVSGINIARGMRRVSSGDETEIRPTNWNFVKASFEEGQSVDVVGASGELDYDGTGETSAPIDVWTVLPSADDFEVVETFTP